MLIKVKITPDNDLFGDMGTSYIETSDKDFIQALSFITDYKEMIRFLDDNEDLFTELMETPNSYDLEFDVTDSAIKMIEDDSIDLIAKIILRGV